MNGIINSMSLYLAFDVGGSKTAAILADASSILARAESGSIKMMRLSPGQAEANLAAVLGELEAQACVSLQGKVVRTCIGTSGISSPAVRQWLQAAFASSVGGELVLLGDEVIALDAAFPQGRGVLVIAGTGSNIIGRAATGAMVHTGGWGPALADRGSGHWIGTEALRACFRAIDAAPPSNADAVSATGWAEPVLLQDLPPLLQRCMHALQLPTLDDIIGAANAPGFHSAALVPAVLQAALEGDAIAGEVLHRAGQDLAGLVAAVARKVAVLEGGHPAPLGLAFAGGVLTHLVPVRRAMQAALAVCLPGTVLPQAPVDPLQGALWHARGRPRLA